MQLLRKFLGWLTPSQESTEAAIFTAMWVDGYSDLEIDFAIADYRKSIEKESV